jgi:surface carbohydrate biosynthesis protein
MSLDTGKRHRLYLLVEESDREFASRCLIAAEAARRGMDVTIAPQWKIWERLAHLPTGLMFFKGNNKVQSANMLLAKRAGHLVASIEEEVLGLADEVELRHSYAAGVQNHCDLFLVQGGFQADCLNRHFHGDFKKFKIVGNPRADLLRRPMSDNVFEAAAELRERHGDFILLNTNFGGINPAHGDCLTFYNRSVQVGIVDPNSPKDRDRFVDRMRWERENARMIIAFAKALREARKDVKIVLRPHPAERMERWHQYFGPNPPVEIIHEGSHLPWTAASTAVVHTGCTTGFEAALMGKPALSLVPGENLWHGAPVSNHANPTARTLDEALGRIFRHLDGLSPSLLDEMRALDYSHYLDHDPETLSATRVVDALQDLAGRLSVSEKPETADVWRQGKSETQVWQSQKYSVSLDHARRSINKMSGHLGQTMPLEITEIADGTIRIQRSAA